MSTSSKPLKGKEELTRYLAECTALERDLLVEKEKSKRMAWAVAFASMGLACLGIMAGVAGLRQESPPPTVLRVDNATGAVEALTIQKETEVSYGEVVDSYFLNKYVINRESYDYATIQSMYDTTRLMSGFDAWQSYSSMYSGPNARDVVLNNRSIITVNVRAISADPNTGIATVRYTTQQKNSNGQTGPLQHWIATVGYTYLRSMMTVEERRINPLGFAVTSYRSDPEVVKD